MPNDSELDNQRVQEALRRGWLRKAQVDACQIAPVLDALFHGGLLTEAQFHELCAMGKPESRPPTPPDADDPHPLSESLSPGNLLHNRYRIDEIPTEGSGRVLLCTDMAKGRRCALKRPQNAQTGSAEEFRKFRDGMLLWIGLGDHPNIVSVYGLEESSGRPFVVMEAVEGSSLGKRMTETPLGWRQAASFGWQVANGLDYAIQVCGLVHGNLKPSKILVSREGVAKITDFGISPDGGDNALGSAYRAPELWEVRREADLGSEIYAFGAILFELATGRLPFSGSTPEEFSQLHLNQAPPNPRSLEPQMPEPMARLILRCMEKRRKDRPENFASIRRVLEPFAGKQHPEPSFAPIRLGGLVNQCSAYLESRRFEEAESAARNAVQIDSRSTPARIALAEALAARGAYSQALGHLEEAHRLAPTAPAPIVNSSLYANQAGNHTRALRWLAVALDTLPVRHLEALTAMMIDLGRIPQAIEICEKIVREDPTAIVAWNSLSIAQRRSGQLAEALVSATRTVEINPRYARGWSNRATILVQLAQLDEALAAADCALDIEPLTVGAYAAKAAALGQLGRTAEAHQCLLDGLKLLPGNALLVRALVQFP